MPHATFFDCEFLTATGAKDRLWAGPTDPDPLVVQIGAVNLSLEADFAILDTTRIFIHPRDRFGNTPPLDPFFVELTGITQTDLDAHGIERADALRRLSDFSAGSPLWSWGKDELFLFGITCYVAGVAPTLPARRFGNAKQLMMAAGMSRQDIETTTSGQLAAHFDIAQDNRQHHDALDDALSIALSVRHLLRAGRLAPEDVRLPDSTG